MKLYTVDINGLPHTLQLSEAEAERLGRFHTVEPQIEGEPAAKAAAKPRTKAAPKPKNKAAKPAANKAAEPDADKADDAPADDDSDW
ncbi:hypothetical protein [Microbacterium caowuchunii]|uniref:hypothetical protein n=1 Tax=Microbacterium caowuchunii TaxID=2614638 RepID=UPI0017845DC5|nr:hypothetical protein [Microbacterium caowuchunii]